MLVFSQKDEFSDYLKQFNTNFNANINRNINGCFFNNEIQIITNTNSYHNKDTLLHETVHIYFNKYIYEKYNIGSVSWLDESFAYYIYNSSLSKYGFLNVKNNCIKLKDGKENVSIIDKYKIIGYYIF